MLYTIYHPEAKNLRVFLDGEEMRNVFVADPEAGYVILAKPGEKLKAKPIWAIDPTYDRASGEVFLTLGGIEVEVLTGVVMVVADGPAD